MHDGTHAVTRSPIHNSSANTAQAGFIVPFGTFGCQKLCCPVALSPVVRPCSAAADMLLLAPVRASETFASTEYAPREGRSRSLCSNHTGEIVRALVCVSSSTCASEPELALREDVARSDLPLPEDIVPRRQSQRTDNRSCGPPDIRVHLDSKQRVSGRRHRSGV